MSVHSVLLAATLLAAAVLAPLPIDARIPAGVPIGRMKTHQRVIALSFDDGPQGTPVLDSLLAVLAARRAHATFFVIGEELLPHAEIGARLLEAGHELGNHTWTHPRLDSIPRDSVWREIARTDSLLRAVGAKGRILIRPPYGALNAEVIAGFRRRGRVVALFDVDPVYDLPADASADTTVEYTLRLLGPGSILVMHPWYENGPATLATLPRILDRLLGMGYRVVTVSELLRTKHAVLEPSLYLEIMQ